MQQVSDQMVQAGARVLDAVPCLDRADFKRVARDVYAAMREAEGARDQRAVTPKTMLRGCDGRPIDWENGGELRPRPLRPFAFAESQVYEVPADRIGRVFNNPTATSDGRW